MGIEGLNSQHVNQDLNNKKVPKNVPNSVNFDGILAEMFSAGMFEDVDLNSIKNKKKKIQDSVEESLFSSESSAIAHGLQISDQVKIDSLNDLEVDRSFYHKALGFINQAIKQLLPHSDL